MVNLGIISGTLTDNNPVKLDEDAIGTKAPYVFGSIYNNGTTTVTVNVQINTPYGLKNAPIPLVVGQIVKFKAMQIHSIQCSASTPVLNYVFSIVEIESDLLGETEY